MDFSRSTPAKDSFLPGLEPDPAGLDYEAVGVPSPYMVGRYTAAEFLRRFPDKSDNLCRLLGKGVGQLECARLVGCSVHTVRAVLGALPENIAIERERHRRNLRTGAALVLDALLDDLSDPERLAAIPARDKAVILGILEDKAAGPAPAAVTVNINAPGHRDLSSYLDRLQAVGGDSTGTGAGGMGFGAGAGAAKGAALGAGGEDAEEVGAGDQGQPVEEGKTDVTDYLSAGEGVQSVEIEGDADDSM